MGDNGDGDDAGNPGGFVTHVECAANSKFILGKLESMKEDIVLVNRALYGSEGRQGMVKDVTVLLQRSTWTDRIVSVGLAIATSVITAYIVAIVIRGG